MKEFKYTLTLNVFILAEDEESAEGKFQDMDLSLNDPDTDDLLEVELIDCESVEVGEIEDDNDSHFDEE